MIFTPTVFPSVTSASIMPDWLAVSLVKSVGLPLLIAVVLLLLSIRPWVRADTTKRAGIDSRCMWGPTASIGLGFIISFLFIHGVPTWPPQAPPHFVFPIAVGALVVALALSLLRPRMILTSIVHVVVFAAMVWFMFPPAMKADPGGANWLLAAGLFTILLTIGSLGLEGFVRSKRGAWIPAGLMLHAFALAGFFALIHLTSLAQEVGIIGAMLALIALTLLLTPGVPMGHGPAWLAYALWSLLVLQSLPYLPSIWLAMPLALGPNLVWLYPGNDRGRLRFAWIRIILMAVPALLTLASVFIWMKLPAGG